MATTFVKGATRPAATGGGELSELAAHLRLVITRTARRLRQEAGTNLGPSQTAALATIERHGPLTPSELAEIERVADPIDRRSFTVATTSKGAALMQKLRTRKNAYLARRLRGLDPDELATLARSAEILEALLEGDRR